MSSIFEETPAERAKRYLLLADAARRRADRATAPDVKANYLRLAQEWEALALQVERQIKWGRPPGWERPPDEARPGSILASPLNQRAVPS